jgi:hypothetical protein
VPIKAHGELVGEVRLGILPIGSTGASEPVFMRRLWTLISFDPKDLDRIPDRDRLKFSEMLALPFLPSDRVMINPLWRLKLEHENIIEDDGPLASLVSRASALVFGDYETEEDGFIGGVTIDRVSSASCRALLGLKYDFHPSISSPAQGLLTDLSDMRDDHREYLCRTPPGTLGRVLETSFFQARTECRLDVLLDRQVGRLADEVNALVGPYIETSRRLHEEILSHLNQNRRDA